MRLISADYHSLVDGKSKEEKDLNLKKVREWAAASPIIGDQIPRSSAIARIRSIRDKFAGLVCVSVIHADTYH